MGAQVVSPIAEPPSGNKEHSYPPSKDKEVWAVQAASFRMISTIVSILLLAALVLVILLAFRDNSTTALQILPTRTPVATRAIAESQPTAAPVTPAPQPLRPAFGQPRRVESGGFAFRPLTGYVLELAGTSATLDAGSEGPAEGAMFILSGGAPTDFITDTTTTLDDAFRQVVGALRSKAEF